MLTQLTALVVDNDQAARHSLGVVLQAAGHQVVTAATTIDAFQQLAANPIDVVVSDLYLSNARPLGLDVLREARRLRPDCEVILITSAPRMDTAIEALRAGACDYLTKPLIGELLVESVGRVQERLLQRRQQQDALVAIEASIRKVLGQNLPSTQTSPALQPTPSKQYAIGPVMLDEDRYIIEVDGHRINATPSEIEILIYLCRNPHRVITPQELIRTLRGYTVGQRDAQETIRSHISNLRRKLLAVSPKADVIETVRSVGYTLSVSPHVSP